MKIIKIALRNENYSFDSFGMYRLVVLTAYRAKNSIQLPDELLMKFTLRISLFIETRLPTMYRIESNP